MNQFATAQFKPTTSSALTPTEEQQLIISTAQKGENIAIKAFAGAAKTSTCIMVANAVPEQSLYVAFNKPIADEAAGKFPAWVKCQTIHSLAWRAVIKHGKSKYAKKLQNFYNYDDINIPLINPTSDIETKVKIVNTIKEFCQSDSSSLQGFLDKLHPEEYNNKYVLTYWQNMINQDHEAKITPDIYLKLYHLSQPILSEYKVIYLDEAQDSNPVTLAIVLAQVHAQLVIVGDPYQSIYEWRGAINAFDKLLSYDTHFNILYLTESFRFTQEIADLASKLTFVLGNGKSIVGKSTEKDIQSKAVLVRTNSTLLDYLLTFSDEGKKVEVLADLRELWGKLYHIQALYYKEPIRFPDKELSVYKSYTHLIEAAEHLPELKKFVSLCIKLSLGGLTANINKIKACIVKDGEVPDVTISTGHKAKGKEWDEVTIADGFIMVKENQSFEEALFSGQTLELLYVALTRAKYKVNLSEDVLDVIYNWDYFQKQYISFKEKEKV